MTATLSTLISLVITALVLYVLFHIVGKFMSGGRLRNVGILLSLLFVLYTLRAFRVLDFLPGP
jgi:hypothetical protein